MQAAISVLLGSHCARFCADGRRKSDKKYEMSCLAQIIETNVTLHGSGDRVHLTDIKQCLYLSISDWNSTINS